MSRHVTSHQLQFHQHHQYLGPSTTSPIPGCPHRTHAQSSTSILSWDRTPPRRRGGHTSRQVGSCQCCKNTFVFWKYFLEVVKNNIWHGMFGVLVKKPVTCQDYQCNGCLLPLPVSSWHFPNVYLVKVWTGVGAGAGAGTGRAAGRPGSF